MNKYFDGKDLSYEGMEKDGFYLEGDEIVERTLWFRIIAPPEVNIIETKQVDGQWLALGTHPGLLIVEDGSEIPIWGEVNTPSRPNQTCNPDDAE